MSRLGILGGSFNPIHFGHLRAAEEIRQRLALDKVLFVPSYVPPHKESDTMAVYHHRKNMTRLAIADNPHFVIEDVEERLPAPSYTYRTLEALQQK